MAKFVENPITGNVVQQGGDFATPQGDDVGGMFERMRGHAKTPNPSPVNPPPPFNSAEALRGLSLPPVDAPPVDVAAADAPPPPVDVPPPPPPPAVEVASPRPPVVPLTPAEGLAESVFTFRRQREQSSLELAYGTPTEKRIATDESLLLESADDGLGGSPESPEVNMPAWFQDYTNAQYQTQEEATAAEQKLLGDGGFLDSLSQEIRYFIRKIPNPEQGAELYLDEKGGYGLDGLEVPPFAAYFVSKATGEAYENPRLVDLTPGDYTIHSLFDDVPLGDLVVDDKGVARAYNGSDWGKMILKSAESGLESIMAGGNAIIGGILNQIGASEEEVANAYERSLEYSADAKNTLSEIPAFDIAPPVIDPKSGELDIWHAETWLSLGTQALPSLALQLATARLGAGAVGAAAATGKKLGGNAMKKILTDANVFKAQAVVGLGTAVATNAALSGGQVAAQVYEKLIADGVPPAEARTRAESGALYGALWGMATARISLGTKQGGLLSSSVAVAAAREAAQEAVEETGQTIIAASQTGETVTGRQLAESAVAGAIGGAVAGGGLSGAQSANRNFNYTPRLWDLTTPKKEREARELAIEVAAGDTAKLAGINALQDKVKKNGFGWFGLGMGKVGEVFRASAGRWSWTAAKNNYIEKRATDEAAEAAENGLDEESIKSIKQDAKQKTKFLIDAAIAAGQAGKKVSQYFYDTYGEGKALPAFLPPRPPGADLQGYLASLAAAAEQEYKGIGREVGQKFVNAGDKAAAEILETGEVRLPSRVAKAVGIKSQPKAQAKPKPAAAAKPKPAPAPAGITAAEVPDVETAAGITAAEVPDVAEVGIPTSADNQGDIQLSEKIGQLNEPVPDAEAVAPVKTPENEAIADEGAEPAGVVEEKKAPVKTVEPARTPAAEVSDETPPVLSGGRIKSSGVVDDNLRELPQTIVSDLSPDDILTDPAAFQIRADYDEKTGSANTVAGVKAFESNQAMDLLFFEEDGKLTVVNGHNRLALARELSAKNYGTEKITVGGIVLRKSDGWTKETARAVGAIHNIQSPQADVNSRGNLVGGNKERIFLTAAVLREAMKNKSVLSIFKQKWSSIVKGGGFVSIAAKIAGVDVQATDDTQDTLITPNGKGLTDEAFRAYRRHRGDIRPEYIAEVAEQITETSKKGDWQLLAIQGITERKPTSLQEAKDIVSSVLDYGIESQQPSLLGNAPVEVDWTIRATVLAGFRKMLQEASQIYGILSTKSAALESTGLAEVSDKTTAQAANSEIKGITEWVGELTAGGTGNPLNTAIKHIAKNKTLNKTGKTPLTDAEQQELLNALNAAMVDRGATTTLAEWEVKGGKVSLKAIADASSGTPLNLNPEPVAAEPTSRKNREVEKPAETAGDKGGFLLGNNRELAKNNDPSVSRKYRLEDFVGVEWLTDSEINDIIGKWNKTDDVHKFFKARAKKLGMKQEEYQGSPEWHDIIKSGEPTRLHDVYKNEYAQEMKDTLDKNGLRVGDRVIGDFHVGNWVSGGSSSLEVRGKISKTGRVIFDKKVQFMSGDAKSEVFTEARNWRKEGTKPAAKKDKAESGIDDFAKGVKVESSPIFHGTKSITHPDIENTTLLVSLYDKAVKDEQYYYIGRFGKNGIEKIGSQKFPDFESAKNKAVELLYEGKYPKGEGLYALPPLVAAKVNVPVSDAALQNISTAYGIKTTIVQELVDAIGRRVRPGGARTTKGGIEFYSTPDLETAAHEVWHKIADFDGDIDEDELTTVTPAAEQWLKSNPVINASIEASVKASGATGEQETTTRASEINARYIAHIAALPGTKTNAEVLKAMGKAPSLIRRAAGLVRELMAILTDFWQTGGITRARMALAADRAAAGVLNRRRTKGGKKFNYGEFATIRNQPAVIYGEQKQSPLFTQPAPEKALDKNGKYKPSGDPRLKGTKITDAKGKPLRLYHGRLSNDTGEFSTELLGRNTNATSAKLGFFFSETKETANAYREYSWKDTVYPDNTTFSFAEKIDELMGMIREDRTGNLPAGLADYDHPRYDEIFPDVERTEAVQYIGDITKYHPDRYDEDRMNEEFPDGDIFDGGLLDQLKAWTENLAAKADGVIAEDAKKLNAELTEKGWGAMFDNALYEVFLHSENPHVHQYKGEEYQDLPYTAIIEDAIKKGHDSVTLKNTKDGAELDNIYIVFSPEQIINAKTGETMAAAKDVSALFNVPPDTAKLSDLDTAIAQSLGLKNATREQIDEAAEEFAYPAYGPRSLFITPKDITTFAKARSFKDKGFVEMEDAGLSEEDKQVAKMSDSEYEKWLELAAEEVSEGRWENSTDIASYLHGNDNYSSVEKVAILMASTKFTAQTREKDGKLTVEMIKVLPSNMQVGTPMNGELAAPMRDFLRAGKSMKDALAAAKLKYDTKIQEANIANGKNGWMVTKQTKDTKTAAALMAETVGCGWCLAQESYAQQYLRDGDVALYYDNGKPQIAIAYKDGNTLAEPPRGRLGGQRLPNNYYDVAESYLRKHKTEGAEEYYSEKAGRKALVVALKTGELNEYFYENFVELSQNDKFMLTAVKSSLDVLDIKELNILREKVKTSPPPSVVNRIWIEDVLPSSNFKNIRKAKEIDVDSSSDEITMSKLETVGDLRIVNDGTFTAEKLETADYVQVVGGAFAAEKLKTAGEVRIRNAGTLNAPLERVGDVSISKSNWNAPQLKTAGNVDVARGTFTAEQLKTAGGVYISGGAFTAPKLKTAGKVRVADSKFAAEQLETAGDVTIGESGILNAPQLKTAGNVGIGWGGKFTAEQLETAADVDVRQQGEFTAEQLKTANEVKIDESVVAAQGLETIKGDLRIRNDGILYAPSLVNINKAPGDISVVRIFSGYLITNPKMKELILLGDSARPASILTSAAEVRAEIKKQDTDKQAKAALEKILPIIDAHEAAATAANAGAVHAEKTAAALANGKTIELRPGIFAAIVPVGGAEELQVFGPQAAELKDSASSLGLVEKTNDEGKYFAASNTKQTIARLFPPAAGSEKFALAGVNAAGADKSALAKAQWMTGLLERPTVENVVAAMSDKKRVAKVWKETGWILGRDGAWRFEVDTNDASLSYKFRSKLNKVIAKKTKDEDSAPSFSMTMEDALGGEFSLFKHYPKLRKVKINFNLSAYEEVIDENTSDIGYQAHYGSGRGLLGGIKQGEVEFYWPLFMVKGNQVTAGEGIISTLIHELQHYIQNQEGSGGIGKSADIYTEGYDAYRNSVIEAEAREAQKRIGKSAEWRRDNPPSWAGIAPKDLVDRGNQEQFKEAFPQMRIADDFAQARVVDDDDVPVRGDLSQSAEVIVAEDKSITVAGLGIVQRRGDPLWAPLRGIARRAAAQNPPVPPMVDLFSGVGAAAVEMAMNNNVPLSGVIGGGESAAAKAISWRRLIEELAEADAKNGERERISRPGRRSIRLSRMGRRKLERPLKAFVQQIGGGDQSPLQVEFSDTINNNPAIAGSFNQTSGLVRLALGAAHGPGDLAATAAHEMGHGIAESGLSQAGGLIFDSLPPARRRQIEKFLPSWRADVELSQSADASVALWEKNEKAAGRPPSKAESQAAHDVELFTYALGRHVKQEYDIAEKRITRRKIYPGRLLLRRVWNAIVELGRKLRAIGFTEAWQAESFFDFVLSGKAATYAAQKSTHERAPTRDAPTNERFALAGVNAAGADRSALATAQKMTGLSADASGADIVAAMSDKAMVDKVWKKTGWILHRDGKWRFEIDDKSIKFRDKDFRIFDTITHRKINEVFDLGEVGKQYPQIGKYSLTYEGGWPGGYLTAYSNQIVITARDKENFRDIFIHELQHAIQRFEGMGQGTDHGDSDYWENAGEAEAREVQKRAGKSAKWRAANPPKWDGIAPKDLVKEPAPVNAQSTKRRK